jgi:hypothetical protein
VIRPLRALHRGVFSVLVVAVPAALGWTLLQRPVAPFARAAHEAPVSVTVMRDGDDTARVRVTVPASRPEMLVYLGEGASPDASAQFLGMVVGDSAEFRLPPGARGNVLVFSPVLRAVVARQPLAAAP